MPVIGLFYLAGDPTERVRVTLQDDGRPSGDSGQADSAGSYARLCVRRERGTPCGYARATNRSTPMSQRTATIESLPMAFEVVKAMRADGLEWGEGYRPLGRQALAEIIQGRMAEAVDDWLDSLDGSAMRDRRNGSYSRHLLTELGDIELSVPRTRRFCPSEVLRSYARRAPEIDRAILAGFVLGLSTRKVGEVLLALLGRKVSASTVSRVAKTLDEAVGRLPCAPACRPLQGAHARRRGAGAQDRRRRAETPRPGAAGYPGGRPSSEKYPARAGTSAPTCPGSPRPRPGSNHPDNSVRRHPRTSSISVPATAPSGASDSSRFGGNLKPDRSSVT